jgi:hypothetical protein
VSQPAPARVIYLASPMTTYHTPLYERNRQRVAALFPGAELICPPDGPLYPTPQVFRATYRQHLHRCTDLVCFDAGDHVATRGMSEEIRYADLIGKPVWYLADDGDLVPLN